MFWTKEKCHEEALKYSSLFDFRKFSNGAYQKSIRNNWLNDISNHMIRLKPKGYWTKEKCHEEALKYNKRSDFSKNSSTAYSYACIQNFIDEICSHMIIIGNRHKRCIYVYEFSNNSAYVGLTYNISNRNIRHLKDIESPVYKNINNGFKYEFKKLTDYVNVKQAQKLENYYFNVYKNNGWDILNKSKTGNLGGDTLKWTREKCKEVALKYNSIAELQKNNQSVYNTSRKNGWLDYVCSHMKRLHKPNGYWTKEKCKEEVLKYDSIVGFQKKSSSVYFIARKNGWLDYVCSHMKRLHKPNGYWTKEKCQEIALKYNNKTDFKLKNGVVYTKAWKNNWLDDICLHMKKIEK